MFQMFEGWDHMWKILSVKFKVLLTVLIFLELSLRGSWGSLEGRGRERRLSSAHLHDSLVIQPKDRQVLRQYHIFIGWRQPLLASF